MSELAKAFVDYGALGIVALVSLAMTMKLYRDNVAERKTNREEMHTLEERYITKADTWMEKYHQHQESMNRLLEALSKRRPL